MCMFSKNSYGSVLGVLAALVQSAYAQTTPDAGALRQQIERQLPSAVTTETKPLTALPPEFTPAAGLSISVKAFRFAGNTLLSDAQIAPAVAGYLNRPIGFKELQQATAAVGDVYRAAGWLVRVYLPRQEITSGIVTLQIVEGIFGKLRFDGVAPSRLSINRVQATIAATQPAGQALKAGALDRAMLLLDDLPGVAVSGNLAPGGGQAETDLVLKLVNEPLLNGDAGLDNTGSRSTGEERLTVNAFLNSPASLGDQITSNLIHTQGSDYLRLSYSVPLGPDGMRLGINGSRMNYKIISSDFVALKLKGYSSSWGIDLQYPLIRSRSRNLYLSAGYDDKQFDNRAADAITTRYGVHNLSLGLMGNLFDKWGGGGASMASLNLTAGDLNLDGSPNQAADAATTKAQGSFTKLRYALSRQQALTDELSLYGLLTGQFASKNLDSSEKFYLGGANGVRAFPASEGGGAEGTLLNLELRYRAMTNLIITGFYDWGSVTVNRNNSYTGAPALNRFALEGVGVSLAWTGPKGITVKGSYAHRLGSNPNRDTATGNDQDGSLVQDRFWLTASVPF